jgi:hypothetical protein
MSSFFLSKKPAGFQLILVETAGTPAKNSDGTNNSIDASNSRCRQQMDTSWTPTTVDMYVLQLDGSN